MLIVGINPAFIKPLLISSFFSVSAGEDGQAFMHIVCLSFRGLGEKAIFCPFRLIVFRFIWSFDSVMILLFILGVLSLIYKYIIVVMYSKYLEYSEPANKAHLSAQRECEEKDVIIGQLKNDIYQLKQLDGDYHRLNDLINGLEGKYSLLLAEKDRSQKEQKVKFDIDKKNILDLRAQIDDLRVQLQKSNLVIEELLRENTNVKRQCDNRSNEIQNIRYQIKEIQNKNQRSNDENRALSITIKGLKEERKRLEDDCEHLSSLLDEQISRLKNLEKDVRSVQSSNARLEKTLYQAEKDNSKLVAEQKEKNQEIKRTEGRLKNVHNSIAQIGISYKNYQQQAGKSKAELERQNGALENQLGRGKQFQTRIAAVEATIRNHENDLDLVISQEQKLRKEHFAALEKNKTLNLEIDKILALIAEYELVNKELLDEIEIFIDQDQQARSMLDRKEYMQEIIESSLRKIAITEEPIRHLKC